MEILRTQKSFRLQTYIDTVFSNIFSNMEWVGEVISILIFEKESCNYYWIDGTGKILDICEEYQKYIYNWTQTHQTVQFWGKPIFFPDVHEFWMAYPDIRFI